ncbi:hypothetical protein GCWU000341_02540 [Oribacterium sp. oral taxon 078 str. F0262]|nr:hypothetical protein GCWU000341_02540 [Oribacterium sp. oral taxon 078 str. F0262]
MRTANLRRIHPLPPAISLTIKSESSPLPERIPEIYPRKSYHKSAFPERPLRFEKSKKTKFLSSSFSPRKGK